MSKKKNELKAPDSPEAMLVIIERAQSGDEEAMPALREMLDRVPSFREELGADLDRTVEYSISKSLGGEDNLAFREAIKRKLAALREELEGPTPSPTERLLVDRIVACWLQVQEADLRYAQAGNCSFAQANYHLRRQDRAHRSQTWLAGASSEYRRESSQRAKRSSNVRRGIESQHGTGRAG